MGKLESRKDMSLAGLEPAIFDSSNRVLQGFVGLGLCGIRVQGLGFRAILKS